MESNIKYKKFNEKTRKLDTEIISFENFDNENRKNAQVYWLYRAEDNSKASAAIVRYKKGGFSPEHIHTGFELIYMLDGEMNTSQEVVKKGDIIYYDPDTKHDFYTDKGCLALITWGAKTIASTERD